MSCTLEVDNPIAVAQSTKVRCSAVLIWGRRPGGFLESYWSSVHIGSSKGFKMHMTRLKKLVPTLVMESAEAATE